MFDNEYEEKEQVVKQERSPGEPTMAFQGASWVALLIGVSAHLSLISSMKYQSMFPL